MATELAPAGFLEGGERISTGRITWFCRDDVAFGGRYRIRNVAPSRWELIFRDRVLSEHHRLSTARVAGELHHRGVLRRADLTRWGALAAGGIAVIPVLADLGGPAGILGTVCAVWVFGIAAPRFVAALTGNLLDPFRRRDPWEPPDWWNRNP